MKVILPFSGGIDSTSVLQHLVESGHEVTTLHVDLRGRRSERWQAERIAVARILGWYGSRGVLIRHIDGGATHLTGKWYDIEVMAMHVGHHVRADPRFEATTDNSSGYDLSREYSGMSARVANRVTITELIGGRKLHWIAPNREKSREQVIAEMPAELVRLTNYCRTPRVWLGGFAACGSCETCKVTRLG